ncbi:MAG: ABC-F family ATP-binding cassette domain-containing protein [Micrococcaceae bacterium]
MPAIILNNISFSFSEDYSIFNNVTASFGEDKTGIVGRNGAGKSTLFRLILGEIKPQEGTITTPKNIGYLPQKPTLNAKSIVTDLFGATAKLQALKNIEAGSMDTTDYDILGDDWDIREQIVAKLSSIGLTEINVERKLATLSGGEVMLTALAGLQFQDFPVVLLDEPTNNLDLATKELLYEQIRNWKGTLLVISHDIELLELMDETAEIYNKGIDMYGGPYSFYQEILATEQNRALQLVKTAEQKVKLKKRQRQETEKKLATKKRVGNKAFAEKRAPKMIMNLRKRKAQVSAGKLRDQADNQVATANNDLVNMSEKVRDITKIKIDLPDPKTPTNKILVKLYSPMEDVVIKGQDRVVLTGKNGIGKTQLINALLTNTATKATYGESFTKRIGHLPQRLNNLSEEKTLLENIQESAPNALDNEIRAQLARFLFRADQVYKKVNELSGGERFRVSLAKLLLANPANQLLILDEPSNNLDLDSVNELVSALENYRGATLLISHDLNLISKIQADTVIKLTDNGIVIK